MLGMDCTVEPHPSSSDKSSILFMLKVMTIRTQGVFLTVFENYVPSAQKTSGATGDQGFCLQSLAQSVELHLQSQRVGFISLGKRVLDYSLQE